MITAKDLFDLSKATAVLLATKKMPMIEETLVAAAMEGKDYTSINIGSEPRLVVEEIIILLQSMGYDVYKRTSDRLRISWEQK